MSGLVFIRTEDLERIVSFYINEVGMQKWVSQPDIEILQHDNLLIGFHEQSTSDTDALLTFFYDSKSEVDAMYNKFEERALDEPQENKKYKIYNFFATDPDGRKIEFQTFLHQLPPI